MSSYESVRLKYKPLNIRYLLIAESPPPPPQVQSSRQFYYSDRIRRNDRLFVNTIKALYESAAQSAESEIEEHKEEWLRRLQRDGVYMIEALQESQEHQVTKQQRQERIRNELPMLIKKVSALVDARTELVLIKSNVFKIASDPLKAAGFTVLNDTLVDYPGQFNQRAYQKKLASLVHI